MFDSNHRGSDSDGADIVPEMVFLAPGKSCPSPERMEDYAQGRLNKFKQRLMQWHLRRCDACLETVSELWSVFAPERHFQERARQSRGVPIGATIALVLVTFVSTLVADRSLPLRPSTGTSQDSRRFPQPPYRAVRERDGVRGRDGVRTAGSQSDHAAASDSVPDYVIPKGRLGIQEEITRHERLAKEHPAYLENSGYWYTLARLWKARRQLWDDERAQHEHRRAIEEFKKYKSLEGSIEWNE